MAIFDTFSFPPTDWVTGKPTIDGWTDNMDPGTAVHMPEPGYSSGGRITYAGGGLVPSVTFQATEVNVTSPADVGLDDPMRLPHPANGTYLAMGFFCTFDPEFNASDGITIAILPDFATKTHTTARRIDLLPNSSAGAGNGGPAGGVFPGGPLYDERLNRDLNSPPSVWKGDGTNLDPNTTQTRWTSTSINNLFARCSSWKPTTQNTNLTAGGSKSGTYTLIVTDTSQFPSFGNLDVPVMGGGTASVTYTGKTPTTFTGCQNAAGGTINLDTSRAVKAPDRAWSLEVLIPTTVALGGANWVDIQPNFGLYVNLFRFSVIPQPMPPSQPHAGFFAAQYRFPLPDAGAVIGDQHYLFGDLDNTTYIGEDWYGKAHRGVLSGGPDDPRGITFQNVTNPSASVGVRHPGSSSLTSYIYGNTPPPPPQPNTLVAQIQNTGTNAVNNITAQFRFGKWGNPPADPNQWEPHTKFATGPGSVPTTINLGAGAAGEITADWPNAEVPVAYLGDTCMWVRLDSTDNAMFAQDGVRHNIIFTSLSEHEQDATISGSGYPEPENGSHHDFVLMTHAREIVERVQEGGDFTHLAAGRAVRGQDVERVLGWYWVVETFRRPGVAFTVKGDTAEVLDPSPGHFGAFAQHENAKDDVFVGALWGGGLQRYGDTYALRVPHKGEVTVHTWMGAGPPGTVKPPAGATETGGCLMAFIAWLRNLFK